MYYLLEDNRIVDSKDFEELVIKNNDIEKAKKIIKQNNVKKYCYCIYPSKIKKQSKNVYDLIEIGDLIKYQFINGYYELVSTVELVTEINIVFKQKEYIGVLGKDIEKNKDILAIYKPDEKGNYIKVWEKKNE